MTLALAPFLESYDDWLVAERERRVRLALLPMLADEELARSRAEQIVPREPADGTELQSVRRADAVAGWLWVRRDRGLEVLDADVDAPAEELLGLLRAEAGDGVLLLDRLVGAETADALAALPGWSPAATHMVIEVAAAPSEGRLRLSKIGAETWQTYLDGTLSAYADEMAASLNLTAEEAMAKSVQDYAELLPEGPDSPGQFVFDVWDGDDLVALLWIGQHGPRAGFVYDIVVREEARGRGLGRATMNAGATWCRDRGYAVLGLNVFGANTIARGLYDSMGFRVTDEQLRYDGVSR